MTTVSWILLIVAVTAIAAAGFLAWKHRRSRAIRSKFGPEYDYLVRERGSVARAEKELEHRARRVERFEIRPLTEDERSRFAERWRIAQERFVDEPRAAVAEAGDLLLDVMKARGYPPGDFEERVGDLSVNHAHFVEHYRAANEIAVRGSRDSASTEDLRAAMKHYRALFEDLLDRRVSEVNEVRL